MAGPSRDAGRHAFHRLRVSAIEPLTDDSVAVNFELPDRLRETFAFAPGQHLTLARPTGGDGVRRPYSICSPAGGPLRVAVKRLPGGVFSTWLHGELRPGDELDVLPPVGRFTVAVEPQARRHYAAIAAGSGITPVISILGSVLAGSPGSRFSLVYGNRTAETTMFLDELAELKDRHLDRFHLVHVLSREQHDVPLADGRIDAARMDVLLGSILPAAEVDGWFLCGPMPLVETAAASLRAHGVDPRRVHRELFHAGPTTATEEPVAAEPGSSGARTEFTVMLDGRRTRFAAPRDGRSVLTAVLGARSDAPYACRGGVCGTCRCRLLEGEVRMDHAYALEQDEIDAGIVLACQSFPVGERVAVDFDLS